jgi:hypothetical protein
MKRISPFLLGLSLAVAGSSLAAAQDNASRTSSIPSILQVTREYTKPYKGGAAHDKTESAFVADMARAKWPTHYLGMTSLSGKSRALYFTSYDSLEAWEKDNAAIGRNKVLAAELEHDSIMDGELLDEVDQGVFRFSEEQSLNPIADLSHQRFMEISAYQVRPGHEKEWHEAVKLVKDGYIKAGTGAHWAMFYQIYGNHGGRYLVLESHKTLAEIDRDFLNDKQFEEALGEDGLKRLNSLIEASVESSDHELYQFNPHMSYVSEDWVMADPEFWKPKPAAPAAKPAAEKEKPKP